MATRAPCCLGNMVGTFGGGAFHPVAGRRCRNEAGRCPQEPRGTHCLQLGSVCLCRLPQPPWGVPPPAGDGLSKLRACRKHHLFQTIISTWRKGKVYMGTCFTWLKACGRQCILERAQDRGNAPSHNDWEVKTKKRVANPIFPPKSRLQQPKFLYPHSTSYRIPPLFCKWYCPRD